MKAVSRLFQADLVQKPLQRMWSGAHLLVLHLWSCICEDSLSSPSPDTLSWAGWCTLEPGCMAFHTRIFYRKDIIIPSFFFSLGTILGIF